MTLPVYRAVDHVVIRLTAIEPLFSLLSQVFALPVSWPRESSDFATFGWINVGNTNLELWAATDNSDLPPDLPPPFFHGFALDPADLDMSIAGLADAGIACKTPRPYQTKDAHGAWVTNFTNSVVLDVSSESCCIFFCAWGRDGNIFPWKEKMSSVERRAKVRAAFEQCAGGPLGLVGLSGITLGVQDLAEATAKWHTLTGSGEASLSLTENIRMHLVARKRNMIESLTFEVRSLATAKSFLEKNGLLESFDEREISLSSVATDGLQFKFVEAGKDR